LFQQDSVERDAFMFYRGSTLYAARLGPWKAHYITRSAYGSDKPQSHDPPLLFHLGEDPGEKFNRAAEHPDVLTRIREAVDRHRQSVDAPSSQLVETIAP
jgi:hypothetical protein